MNLELVIQSDISEREKQISYIQFSSLQSLSRVWLFVTINLSMPALPVHHQLLESTQTHALCIGDAIQPFN